MTTDITNVQMAYMMTIRLFSESTGHDHPVLDYDLDHQCGYCPAIFSGNTCVGVLADLHCKKAHKYFIKVFDEYDVLNNDVQENVNAARVVKAYVREDHEIKKFHGVSQTVFQLFTKAEKIVAFNNPVMMFVMYTVILVMVLIGGQAIVFGSMEAGELTSVLVYAMQILMSLMMVSFVFVLIMIAEASTDRITEVLKEVPEMENIPEAIKEVPNGDIDFEHVNFSYSGKDGKLALKDVNLHIKSGQMIGIFGGTGSSKSSLVQLIPRLYDVTSGSVKVGDIDVRNYDLESLRDQVSVVLQKNVLLPGLFMTISAGVMKTPLTKRCSGFVSWPRLTALSRNSPTVTRQ